MEREERSAARDHLGIPADRLALQTEPKLSRSLYPNHNEIKAALYIHKHNQIHTAFSFPDPRKKGSKLTATYHVIETLNPKLIKMCASTPAYFI